VFFSELSVEDFENMRFLCKSLAAKGFQRSVKIYQSYREYRAKMFLIHSINQEFNIVTKYLKLI